MALLAVSNGTLVTGLWKYGLMSNRCIFSMLIGNMAGNQNVNLVGGRKLKRQFWSKKKRATKTRWESLQITQAKPYLGCWAATENWLSNATIGPLVSICESCLFALMI